METPQLDLHGYMLETLEHVSQRALQGPIQPAVLIIADRESFVKWNADPKHGGRLFKSLKPSGDPSVEWLALAIALDGNPSTAGMRMFEYLSDSITPAMVAVSEALTKEFGDGTFAALLEMLKARDGWDEMDITTRFVRKVVSEIPAFACISQLLGLVVQGTKETMRDLSKDLSNKGIENHHDARLNLIVSLETRAGVRMAMREVKRDAKGIVCGLGDVEHSDFDRLNGRIRFMTGNAH